MALSSDGNAAARSDSASAAIFPVIDKRLVSVEVTIINNLDTFCLRYYYSVLVYCLILVKVKVTYRFEYSLCLQQIPHGLHSAWSYQQIFSLLLASSLVVASTEKR